MKRSWSRNLCLAGLALLVLSLAGYGRLLARGQVPYSVHSDLVAVHLATKTVLYDSVHGGHGLPFWRSDELAGVPAFTNPESQYTYPLHLLFYFLPPVDAAGPAIFIQLLAGALVLAWVGRVLGLGGWACLLMATAQLFNFKLIAIAYAGFLPILPIATLFPLLFASTFLLIERPGLRATLALAASAVLCLSTGGYQILYYSALFLAGYVLWQAIAWWRGGRRGLARNIALGSLLAGLLSAGVMAYALVPLLAESHLLSRSAGTYDLFLSGYTLTPRHLLNFLSPESFGPLSGATAAGRYLWEDVGYFGIVPLGLALVGGVKGWRRRHTPFLVIGLGLSLVLAMETPLLRFLYETLPGFGRFRMPIRFVYLTGFFGIALAGIGLEEALAILRARRTSGWFAPAASLLAVALIVLVGAEGVHYAHRYIRTRPAGFVLPRTEYADLLARDTTLFRIAPYGRDTVQAGWAAPLKLQLITGATPFNLKDYRSFLEMMETGRMGRGGVYAWADFDRVARRDLLDILNVKYVLSAAPLDQAEEAGFLQVAHLADQPVFAFFDRMKRSDIFIYRNERFLERVFWAGRVVAAPDRDGMIRLMEDEDLRETAVILGEPGPRQEPLGDDERVGIVSSSGGRLEVQTHSREGRFLTISEIRHPGWQGFLDGRPLPLVACDLALMGAFIPAGDHRVVLRFRPMYFSAALGVTVLFLVAWAMLLAALLHQGHQNFWPIRK
jgi:hypothetical protein